VIDAYLKMIWLMEQVHWQYINRIREELDRSGCNDIASIEALILFNVGDDKIACSEIRTRGNYLGSNLSYILKNLIENGYLLHERSPHDLRVVHIWLSDKGHVLRNRLIDMHDGDFGTIPERENDPDLTRTVWTLRQIEQFWIDRELDR
jgi:DNA-binding MarR family transcriptional regulator